MLKKVLLVGLTPLFSTEGPPFREMRIEGSLNKGYNLDVTPPKDWPERHCDGYGKALRSLAVSRNLLPSGYSTLSLAEQLLRLFPPEDGISLEELHLQLDGGPYYRLVNLLDHYWNRQLVRRLLHFIAASDCLLLCFRCWDVLLLYVYLSLPTLCAKTEDLQSE